MAMSLWQEHSVVPPSRLPLREKTSKCDGHYGQQRRAPLDGNAFEPFLGGLFLDEFLCLHPMACEIQNARLTGDRYSSFPAPCSDKPVPSP